MTSVDSNFNFLCGRPHGAGPPVHLSLTPSPLRVDVINGWPLISHTFFGYPITKNRLHQLLVRRKLDSQWHERAIGSGSIPTTLYGLLVLPFARRRAAFSKCRSRKVSCMAAVQLNSIPTSKIIFKLCCLLF